MAPLPTVDTARYRSHRAYLHCALTSILSSCGDGVISGDVVNCIVRVLTLTLTLATARSTCERDGEIISQLKAHLTSVLISFTRQLSKNISYSLILLIPRPRSSTSRIEGDSDFSDNPFIRR